jgi:NAD(P)H dehydrogenase (quinone)
MSIIVTGASGQFGQLVTEVLLQRLPASDLILVTRNPRLLESTAQRGAEVRYGDFDKPDSLRTAFAGGDRMLMISTLSVGRRAQQHRNAIAAAVAAGVRHIVYTSSGGLHPDNPAMVIHDHLDTERVLAASGLSFTILRDSLYAEVAATQIAPRAISIGKWIGSAADGKVGFVSKHDCVAVAASVLTNPGHEGKTYEITGPELLSFREVAVLASRIVARPIEYVVISDDEMRAMLTAAGVPQDYVEGMNTAGIGTSSSEDIVSYERGIREGYFAVRSDHVRQILGRPPMTVRDVLLAHRTQLAASVAR